MAYTPDPEVLGRRRFPDNKGYRKDLANRALDLQNTVLTLLPSNYPKELSTNLGILNRTMAREVARINMSMEAINGDKEYAQTRPEYLQQILGERLFLADKIAPEGYNDQTYRDYLQSIKSAYLAGSKVTVLEALASKFTGLPIHIRELYKEARKLNSSYTVRDSNKMLVEVVVDALQLAGYDINKLKADLDFFINLTRPAHVLYDTRLIWTEQYNGNKIHDIIFGDLGGGCVPEYLYDPVGFYRSLAQMIVALPDSTGATGLISKINTTNYTLDTTNANNQFIVVPGSTGTPIFDISGHQTNLAGLSVGQNVRIASLVIPGNFQFWDASGFDSSSFSAIRDSSAQFYPENYQRPAFQENVKKIMDAQGRFPLQIRATETTMCDRWVEDLLDPMYEDFRSSCYDGTALPSTYSSELRASMGSPRLSWPYDRSSIIYPEYYGNPFVYLMPNTPLTDGSGQPAGISDVSVTFDTTALPVTHVDASAGWVYISDSTSFWGKNYPVSGNEFNFNYHWDFDGTNQDSTYAAVFGIGYWQMPHAPVVTSSGALADKTDLTLTVDGTVIPGAIVDMRPVLGHVLVSLDGDFWRDSSLGRLPEIGDLFRFSYYYGEREQYSMILDDITRPMDSIPGGLSVTGFLFDADASSNIGMDPVIPESPEVIGYRYRAYLLAHSSVLNSPDTLNFNTFQKPATRASLANKCQTINHFNTFFSAEFLYDTNQTIDLDDAYLENGLDPVVKLNAGTPPFQKTYGYQPHLVEERNLQTVRQHHHPLMYSDLLLKEFPEGGNAPLHTICDSNKVGIGIGFKDDTIGKPQECPDWILFDTLAYDTSHIVLPSDMTAVPMLRVMDKLLTHNFILNELVSTGVMQTTYSVTTASDSTSLVFQLPQTISIQVDGTYVDFPALPIVHDATTLASPSDVSVTIGGTPWSLSALDPLTGVATLTDFPTVTKIETQITLTDVDAHRAELILPGIPLDPTNITLTTIHGTAQYYGLDYYVYGRILSWFGTPLASLLEEGDVVRVTYAVNPMANAEVTFTYKIINEADINVIDGNRARLLDYQDVFPAGCYDGYKTDVNWRINEYYSFMDDGGDGLKIKYFNPRTSGFQEHIFSGPVFETWQASQDQIGVAGEFPDALVRLGTGLRGDPLKVAGIDYKYLGDQILRFRKKNFRELLPNNTFRAIEITEVLPV